MLSNIKYRVKKISANSALNYLVIRFNCLIYRCRIDEREREREPSYILFGISGRYRISP